MSHTYAKVISDLIAPSGYRLTHVEAQFPRFILAEVNTHRRFSRNSASSRAIPIEVELQRLMDTPFVPMPFMKNQKGMAGNTPLEPEAQGKAQAVWFATRDRVISAIKMLSEQKVHKQHANRLGEPFQYHKAILSSTCWENFYWQRVNPQAQPEFHELATKIKEAISASVPAQVPTGFWALPYVTKEERLQYSIDICIRVAVARCARISYRKHDTERDIMEDVEMYDRLAAAPHPSPFEHVAQASHFELRSGNYVGWHQHRFDLPKWSGDDIDYEGVLLSLKHVEQLKNLYNHGLPSSPNEQDHVLEMLGKLLDTYGLRG